MKIGSLFTGYGGLDMALGGDLAWYAEIEPAACRVLEAHHPGVPNLGDITKINWDEVEPVDVITGGYPCQPFSQAGQRKGKDDERHLWPFVRDAIRTLRPGYAILENVAGHLTLGFADVLADLAAIGWDAEWTVVRASDVGACHRRERLFILAYADSAGRGEHCRPVTVQQELSTVERGSSNFTADSDGERHGGRERPREVAGMDTEDARQPQQRERSRQKLGTRSDQPAADTDDGHGETVGPMPRLERHASRRDMHEMPDTDWGQYTQAIRRWADIIGRPAPAPTFIGPTGRPRLNPVFVEWMMGLPEGHVTGHGLSAAQCLKMLGNGVVPQQAAHAIQHLTKRGTQCN
jgi:DNA (cytosine-5)-methyltransferase 1